MSKKKFLSIILSINLSLTLMGCSKIVDSNDKDYSINEIVVVDDNLEDPETDLDLEFDEPLIIVKRPYEFVMDYRYLDVSDDEKEKIKISKISFEKDYSSRNLGKKKTKFFRDYCLKEIQIKEINKDLYDKLYDYYQEGIIDIDMNAKKIINNEDAVYLIDAVITFNENVDGIKKGEVITQKYVLSSMDELLAYDLVAFEKNISSGSVNDAIMSIDLIGLESLEISEEDIPVIEEYLYFNIHDFKKTKRA